MWPQGQVKRGRLLYRLEGLVFSRKSKACAVLGVCCVICRGGTENVSQLHRASHKHPPPRPIGLLCSAPPEGSS